MLSPAGLDEPAAPTAATLIGHDSLLVNRDVIYYSSPCGKRGARPLGSGSGAHSGIGAVGGTCRGPGIPAAAACSGDDRGARRGARRASEYRAVASAGARAAVVGGPGQGPGSRSGSAALVVYSRRRRRARPAGPRLRGVGPGS